MTKCPTCGAPAAHTAPDGDFRYRPPVNARPAAEPHPQDARSADVKELLRKIILAAPFYKLFPPTEAQEQEAAMECKKARLALLEAFRQQTWAEAIALCREVRDGVAAPQTKIGTEYCIDALERALTPLERKEG